MEGQLRGLLVTGYGEYEFDDSDRHVEYVTLFDADAGSEAGIRLTLDESLQGDRPAFGSFVDVDVVGEIRQVVRRGKRQDGGEWELPQSVTKFKVTGFKLRPPHKPS